MEKQRIVNSAEDLIFYTNTDESEYPIFITNNREIYTKVKPKDTSSTVVATFYVSKIEEVSQLEHPLREMAVQALKDVTKSELNKVTNLKIHYEVYRGDREELVTEVFAYCVKIESKSTPYSGSKYAGSKAWAIGYDWHKRLCAKYPQLSKYSYVKGETGSKERASVWISIKLPVVTPEFEKVFNAVISPAPTVSLVSELDKQISELKNLIEAKKKELEELEKRLQELITKRQLEELKKAII